MSSNQSDIAPLVAQSRTGDELAVRRLIARHKDLIYTIMIRMVRHPDIARDLTHDTFVRAFRRLPDLRSDELFKTWLCAIARRIALDHLRSERRKPTVSLEETGEILSAADPAVERRRAIIQHALSRLSPRDRMLLVLAYYQGLSLREVALAMKIPESNVRVYIQRARGRLRSLLKGHEHEILF